MEYLVRNRKCLQIKPDIKTNPYITMLLTHFHDVYQSTSFEYDKLILLKKL